MDEHTLDAVSRIAREVRPALVDITGGSPELHPGLPALVSRLRSAGLRTQVRTNLTALLEPDAEGVIGHLAVSGVQLLASGPALTAERYASQRGDHLQAALTVLRRLNDAGWARSGDLMLDLAVDSSGYGEQCSARKLAARYRAVLTDDLGIDFNQLVLMTTMPIGRFRTSLERRGEYESYIADLADRDEPCVPDRDRDRMGRDPLRLRLQSGGRPAHSRGRTGAHIRVRPAAPCSPPDPVRAALLGMHGR
jgi:hypothetical protein